MAEKGMYVRLSINDDDELTDAGISVLCNSCFNKSDYSSDGKYWYSCWEEDLNGDQGECRECGCNVI